MQFIDQGVKRVVVYISSEHKSVGSQHKFVGSEHKSVGSEHKFIGSQHKFIFVDAGCDRLFFSNTAILDVIQGAECKLI